MADYGWIIGENYDTAHCKFAAGVRYNRSLSAVIQEALTQTIPIQLSGPWVAGTPGTTVNVQFTRACKETTMTFPEFSLTLVSPLQPAALITTPIHAFPVGFAPVIVAPATNTLIQELVYTKNNGGSDVLGSVTIDSLNQQLTFSTSVAVISAPFGGTAATLAIHGFSVSWPNGELVTNVVGLAPVNCSGYTR